MVSAETGHFERVSHTTARLFGEILQVGVDVVMGHQHSILLYEQALDSGLEGCAFYLRWRIRDPCPRMGNTRGAARCGALELYGFD
ncbi:hypothetical protein PanNE5_24270 [Pandoraea sp. NE5]|nr:hypothetical protein PanNE5_24270 [Pandoraea sp. NE5]